MEHLRKGRAPVMRSTSPGLLACCLSVMDCDMWPLSVPSQLLRRLCLTLQSLLPPWLLSRVLPLQATSMVGIQFLLLVNPCASYM